MPEIYRVNRGFSVWLTGLSSSGKTTISKALNALFRKYKVPCVVLDGDQVRPFIAEGFRFSHEDRLKVAQKYIQLSQLIIQSEIITIIAAIIHTQEQRDLIRESYASDQFAHIWINTPLEVCIERDVKGIYKKALHNEIDHVVGVSLEYIPPKDPDLIIETLKETPEIAAERIFKLLAERGVLELSQVEIPLAEEGVS